MQRTGLVSLGVYAALLLIGTAVATTVTRLEDPIFNDPAFQFLLTEIESYATHLDSDFTYHSFRDERFYPKYPGHSAKVAMFLESQEVTCLIA